MSDDPSLAQEQEAPQTGDPTLQAAACGDAGTAALAEGAAASAGDAPSPKPEDSGDMGGGSGGDDSGDEEEGRRGPAADAEGAELGADHQGAGEEGQTPGDEGRGQTGNELAGSSSQQQPFELDATTDAAGAGPGGSEDVAATAFSSSGAEAAGDGLPWPRPRSGSVGEGAHGRAAALREAAGLPPASPQDSAGSRPLSALRDLRGSRPNSAAIAAQIEGFEADFAELRPLHQLPEGGPGDTDSIDDARSSARSGPRVEELIMRAQQEQSALLAENAALQRRARAVLDERARGRVPATAAAAAAGAKDAVRVEEEEARYRGALKQWADRREELRRVGSHYAATVLDMKLALEARIRRAEEVAGALAEFRRQVALASRFGRSGRPLGEQMLAQLEERERAAEEEVRRSRLKNVHLANSLKKLEAQLRNREQLAEGLHLIDFEQLKIENQSLSEKIEERNEELAKLRRKNTGTVLVLTHLREKAEWAARRNTRLEAEAAASEAAASEARTTLTAAKARRDGLRAAGGRLKDACERVTDPRLLSDLAAKKELRDDLEAEVESLRRQHATLTAALSASRGAAAAMTTGASGGSGGGGGGAWGGGSGRAAGRLAASG